MPTEISAPVAEQLAEPHAGATGTSARARASSPARGLSPKAAVAVTVAAIAAAVTVAAGLAWSAPTSTVAVVVRPPLSNEIITNAAAAPGLAPASGWNLTTSDGRTCPVVASVAPNGTLLLRAAGTGAPKADARCAAAVAKELAALS